MGEKSDHNLIVGEQIPPPASFTGRRKVCLNHLRVVIRGKISFLGTDTRLLQRIVRSCFLEEDPLRRQREGEKV